MKKFLYVLLGILTLNMISCKEPEPQVEDPKPQIAITAGMVTENSIEFFLSATEADEVAYYFMETTDEVPLLTVEGLFKGENVFAASAEPVSFVMDNLTPETEYTVYAAASKEGKYFSEIKELTINTSEKPKMLQFLSKSKKGFSYKVNVEDGQQYFHTYLEGWYFEYMLEASKYEQGAEFDEKVFVWNLLADHGIFDESAKEFEWYTGKENPMRGDVAYIVPGTRYYVLTALWNEDMGGWIETPEVIGIQLEEPGQSDKTIDCSIYNISPYSVSIRMEMDAEQVGFYMWDFFEKSQYKSYVAENGVEGMMAYVSEYALGKGQAKTNTFTDTWTVNPGTAYMLCVYGVDHNGDEFYTELEVNVPMPDAKIYFSMEPYERDLEGLNTYNTLKVSATFADFVGLDYESSVFYLATGPIEKGFFDRVMESVGLSGSLEELEAQGEMMYAVALANMSLNPVAADPEILAQLNEKGSFEKIYTNLQPDTEYVNMVLAMYDDKMMCRLVSARTDPKPIDVVESDAYKAYLGNWTVKGKMTTDWTTYTTYDLKIDRLTSNRSFKIYGWSGQQVGQDFPFEATFNEANGKITIQTPQVLGTVTIDDYEYEVHFVGLGYSLGELIILVDYEGLAYTGSIVAKGAYDDAGNNVDALKLTPNYVSYGGGQEFRSMSYVLYDRANKQYYHIEEYNLVYFNTFKAN